MEPKRESEAPNASVKKPPRRLWAAPEIAWPLAIFSGFAGTWLGLQVRLPGLSAALAAALFVPLYAPPLARGKRHLVLLLTVGWTLGIAAAVIGTGLEQEGELWSARVLGAGTFIAADLPAPLGAGETQGPFGFPLVRDFAWLVAVAILARPTLGVFGLVLIALAQGAVAAGVLQIARAAAERGEQPLLMAALGWPPHLGLLLVAALTLFVAIAEPGPLWPPRYLLAPRRQLLLIGLLATLSAVVARVLFAGRWAAAMGEWFR